MMDYTALIRELVAPFLDGRVLVLIVLILLRLFTGIAAALKTETFQWRLIGRWLEEDGLWFVGWLALTETAGLLNWGARYAQLDVGSANLTAAMRTVAEGLANATGPVAFATYVLSLVAKILTNTAVLGVTPNAPLPPSASARRP
jgi:hypothetical protein